MIDAIVRWLNFYMEGLWIGGLVALVLFLALPVRETFRSGWGWWRSSPR